MGLCSSFFLCTIHLPCPGTDKDLLTIWDDNNFPLSATFLLTMICNNNERALLIQVQVYLCHWKRTEQPLGK